MGGPRTRVYFVNASAPALATCASCSEVAPDTPTAPTILPVHQDRDPALERAGAAQSQQPEVGATLSDEVLEHLGGTPVEDGRVRLVLGCFDAAQRRAVHALEHDEVATRIGDGDVHVPLVLLADARTSPKLIVYA